MTPGTYGTILDIRAPSDGMIRTRTIQNMITVVRPSGFLMGVS